MNSTSSLQSNLTQLPLRGTSVLVDALFEDTADAEEVVDLLLDVVGPKGTVVVATFTQSHTLSDGNSEAVAFHRDLAVDPTLGAFAEVFRHHPASLRTDHPTNSFAATGPKSQIVLSTNRDNNPLGPVKKLNVMNAWSLRIGQPLRSCSAIHLAEEQCFPELHFRSTAKRINLAGFEERAVVDHVASCSRGFDTLEDPIAAATASERVPADPPIQLVPIRVLIQAARAALSSSPEAVWCGREGCRSCDLRLAAARPSG